MQGTIVRVNASGGGVPKYPLAEARVAASGVEGDRQADLRYHGGPNQALCLFDVDQIEQLNRDGYPVFPGALGENLTTRSINYRAVRPGDTYRTQREVEFQITKPREPCKTITVYGAGIIKRLWGPTIPWGESGFYARVLRPGTIRPGDSVRLVATGPVPPPSMQRRIQLAAQV